MMKSLSVGCLVLAASVASAQAQDVTPLNVAVNCGAAEKIQPVVNKKTRARKLIITISGTCNENVTILRDDVVIKGPQAGARNATIRGHVEIRGDRVELLHLKVNHRNTPKSNPANSDYGVIATRGASIFLKNIAITGHRDGALAVVRVSFARVENSFMTAPPTAGETIAIADGSMVRLINTRVVGNRNESGFGPAIGLYRAGIVRIDQNNKLEHNAASPSDPWTGAAIMALDGSTVRVQRSGNTINGNIVIAQQSKADIRDVTVNGNFRVQENSLVELRSTTTVNGDAQVFLRGLLKINGATGTGTITCNSDGAIFNAAGVTQTGCVVY